MDARACFKSRRPGFPGLSRYFFGQPSLRRMISDRAWSLSETGLPGIAHTTGSDRRFSTYWLSGFGLISDGVVGALYLPWRLGQCT